MSDPHDPRFTLPGVDEPASTEAGIILLGLEADRLLAGVGLARLADDPALVTLAVDQARHDALTGLGFAGLADAGAARWLALRARLADVRLAPGALRKQWATAGRLVEAAVPGLGPASLAYLTACLLRRDDVDELARARADRKEASVLPEVAAD
ncbi:DUF6187 family protein [Amycolatopsis sp. NPDC098790]|uniref:DUF6187 family protein n=1 Tax=Amycolatopsis sp. NPDC098790 TaxID=3363939 RepID=UPI003806FE40